MNQIMKHRKTLLICAALASLLLSACQSIAAASESTTSTGSAQEVAQAQIVAQAQTVAQAQATALPTRAVAATTNIAVDGALNLGSPMASVSFETAGTVTKVNVVPGQAVKQGDVLAELDAAALNLALQQAQESLALKQAQIDKSLAPAEQADIDAATLSLNAAYAAYNALKNGDNSHAVEQALRSWNQAKNALYSAQIQRDQECGFAIGHQPTEEESKIARLDKDCQVADMSVTQAEMRERSSYQSYLDAQKPATQEQLLKAYSSIAQAKAALAKVQMGVSAEQKLVYDLQLEQAKLTVDRAQRNLSKAKLLSPCDCVVQEVTLSAGSSSAGGSVTLLDVSQIKFHTSNLTELDVVKLSSGLKATIRLKSTTTVLTGAVETILPMSSGTSGTAALYTVILSIDATDATLLPGMTGQAEIELK